MTPQFIRRTFTRRWDLERADACGKCGEIRRPGPTVHEFCLPIGPIVERIELLDAALEGVNVYRLQTGVNGMGILLSDVYRTDGKPVAIGALFPLIYGAPGRDGTERLIAVGVQTDRFSETCLRLITDPIAAAEPRYLDLIISQWDTLS